MENSTSGPFDSIPMANPTSTTTPTAARASTEYSMPVVFSASGSEYFRIWIVNLLLTLVTLGLYHPWAKVRRLRYFYGNTSIGGHAFDFHGDPWRMLRGLLLVAVLGIGYAVAGKVSPMAGLVAFLILAAVWPALFRASQHFRMRNTSWRGLRFGFDGTTRGAYAAMLPLFVPGAFTLLIGAYSGHAVGEMDPNDPALMFRLFAPLVVLGLLFPLLMWWLKKYQHDHYTLGPVRTSLKAGPGSYYLLALKTIGVSLLAVAGVLIIAIVPMTLLGFAGAMSSVFSGGGGSGTSSYVVYGVIVLVIIALYGAILAVVLPYVTARAQNLVWGTTAAPELRFESRLRFRSMLGLTFKNWLLIFLTVGLYLPFAKVAMARLRLQAVSVVTTQSPDQLSTSLQADASGAAGDAAGDFFGIDLGL